MIMVRHYCSADQECAVMAPDSGQGWARVLSDPAGRSGCDDASEPRLQGCFRIVGAIPAAQAEIQYNGVLLRLNPLLGRSHVQRAEGSLDWRQQQHLGLE